MLKHVWFVFFSKINFEGFMAEYADSDVIHHLDGKRWVLLIWLLILFAFKLILSFCSQEESCCVTFVRSL